MYGTFLRMPLYKPLGSRTIVGCTRSVSSPWCCEMCAGIESRTITVTTVPRAGAELEGNPALASSRSRLQLSGGAPAPT